MTIKLAEGLVDAVVSYLTTNLPAQLNTEDALWADGVVLDDVNEFVKRDPDQIQRVNAPPFLYVFTDNSQIYDWRSDYVESTHELVLWLVAVDKDGKPEALRIKMYRYANALLKALIAYDGSQSVYKMTMPEGQGAAQPDIDYGLTLTRGTAAMNDVRLSTHWTVREAS